MLWSSRTHQCKPTFSPTGPCRSPPPVWSQAQAKVKYSGSEPPFLTHRAWVRTTSLPNPAPQADVGPAAKGWDRFCPTVKDREECRAARALCRTTVAAPGGGWAPPGTETGLAASPPHSPISSEPDAISSPRAAGGWGNKGDKAHFSSSLQHSI